MKQRWYKVVFETIERKPIRRTVTVCSTDSVHASALVYQQFGDDSRILDAMDCLYRGGGIRILLFG